MPIYAATERPAPLRAELPPPPSRRTVARVVALGVVIAAVVGGVETRRTDVPLPPATATAEEVVRAYLAAVDAGDDSTAKALATPAHAAQVEAYHDSWYHDVISITDLRVEPAVAETPAGRHSEQVWVRVYFDLRELPRFWRTKDDEVWGYRLARTAPGERWLIAGEGKI